MIVSVTGFIGSGKDTVANYLIENYGYTQLSFAGTVKDVVAVLFGWDRDMLEGKTKESREARNEIDEWWATRLGIPDFCPRKALTLIGTDTLRNHFNDKIWIYSVEKKLSKISDNVVISDARYQNELNMLKSIGAKSFCIERGQWPEWYESALKYNKASDIEKSYLNYSWKHFTSKPNVINSNIHSSEYDWIGYKFDHTLWNDKTLEHLYKQIDMHLKDF